MEDFDKIKDSNTFNEQELLDSSVEEDFPQKTLSSVSMERGERSVREPARATRLSKNMKIVTLLRCPRVDDAFMTFNCRIFHFDAHQTFASM